MSDNGNGGWPSAQEETVSPTKQEGETEDQFLKRRDAEIQKWLDDKTAAASSKTAEMESRKTLTTTLFPTPKKGTQRYDLSNGYKIKLVHTVTASLGDKDLTDDEGNDISIESQVKELEEKLGELGNEGQVLARRLIGWTPKLSMSEYKKLDMEFEIHGKVKDLVDQYLVTKDGSPQLTFEEPKPES